GGIVAAECAADANAVPGIGYTQAIAAEDVDAVLLAHRANLARVVNRKLFGDDENLAQLRVDADQLRDAVARRRWRQVDDAAVESMPVVQPFEHAVVDGYVADGRVEHLTAPSGRSAEHDIAAGIRVSYGRHVTRFAAEYVEHADAVLARRDLSERAHA